MNANPILGGTLLALVSALAFGLTTPFIRRFGIGLGPFPTAALLYLGAVLGALPWPFARGLRKEARLKAAQLPRLLLVAFSGAALAPVLFVWGLQRVPASLGALLLNWEALFTVAFAALFFREHLGRRVLWAALFMAGGGCVTVWNSGTGPLLGVWGVLAVIGAVAAWSLDNVLSRPLAEFDPAAVVRAKGLLGALFTGSLAVYIGDAPPSFWQFLGLLLCGFSGYGLSLRLYLLAQRRIGAARTGSVFSLAPFIGAACAVAMDGESVGVTTLLAALLFAVGVLLHLTERHEHEHTHEAFVHDGAHRHDDGHHDHVHEVYPEGPHSHPHTHSPLRHSHPHAPDVHHRHGH